MKKLLMCSAAVALGLAAAHPAKADGIKLDLAGHFKGYVTWLSQGTEGTTNEQHYDILRETEIHFTGETTLDNGLTVGVHHEADIDSQYHQTVPFDLFVTEESYAYFSGAWGRVNFGKEDGANYLLQVAAPSADENYDGLRQYVNPENVFLSNIANLNRGTNTGRVGGGFTGRGFVNNGKLDYADDASGYSNKITYLTPVWSGFQAGGSFTPNVGGNLQPGGFSSFTDGSHAFGVPASNINNSYGNAWEGGLRYEGKWQELGVTLGGGYTHVGLQADNSTVDQQNSFNQWNLGAAFTWQQFGIGGAYTRNNGGVDTNGADRTWVAGIDYTTGPFKIGASYLNNHEGLGTADAAGLVTNGQLDTQRYAGGVIYTYGPGMTFRGSVGFVRSKLPSEQPQANGTDSVDATDLLLGTQINF